MNFKIKYLNIERYDTKAFEKYLEEMALKGWKLAYLSRRILRFRKSEKTNIKYSVRILDKLSTFEGADPKKIDELKKTYEEAGWSFIADDYRLFVFATYNLSAITPCDKSLKEELNYNANSSLKSIALKLLSFICLALFILYTLNNFNFFKDSDFISEAIIIFPLIILLVIYELWNFIGLLSFKREINADIRISPKVKNLSLKINYLTLVVFLYSLIIVVISVLRVTSYLDPFLAIALLNIFQIPTQEIHYRCTLKNKSSSKYIWLMIVIFITFSGGIIYKNSYKDNDKNYNTILTLSDFNRPAEHKYYWRNKNNLILKSMSYAENANNDYLHYNYIEIKYNFLEKKCYEDTINDFKSCLSEHHNDSMSCNFQEIKDLPKGMRGVKISAISSNTLIFNVDNKIIVLSPLESISQDEVVKVVYEKLKKK